MNSPGRFNPWLHEYYARFSATPRPEQPMRVVFIVGSADISGGSYVIFEHALWLKRHGAEVTVALLRDISEATPGWHPALTELRFSSVSDLAGEEFDLAIATFWLTVYELPKLRFRHAVYFVQSAEARFHSHEADRSTSELAELTYTLGIPTITVATWLQMYLSYQHGAPAFLALNGIDKSRYQAGGIKVAEPPAKGLRVLVEGHVDVPMKGVANAIKAATAAGCEEIWLLTPSDIDEYPGVDRVFSRIPVEDTGAVYRSCQVLVKLSQVEGMYGPPLEMFHCGGTVVTSDVSGHEEYIEDGVNALVVPTDDVASAATALRRLREDPELLQRLRRGAVSTAGRWPDWDRASAQFARILYGINRQPAQEVLPLVVRILGSRALPDLVKR